MMRHLLAAVAAVPLLLATPPTPSAPTAPATQAEGLEVEVVGVERLDHSTQLVVGVHNTRTSVVGFAGLVDPAYSRVDEILFNDLSGLRLLDRAADIEYLALRDVDTRTCICSQLGPIEAGATLQVWWRSAPLPDAVDQVDVLGPDGEPLATDVEVAS